MVDPSLMSTISGVGALGYSAQMGLMPETAQNLYFEKKMPRSNQMTRWMGQALLGMAARDLMSAKTPTKGSLRGQAVTWGTAPLMMGIQASNGEFKPAMGVANGLLCAGMCAGCLIAANKCPE